MGFLAEESLWLAWWLLNLSFVFLFLDGSPFFPEGVFVVGELFVVQCIQVNA